MASLRLPDLPVWVADRYRAQIDDYKVHVRRFVREADMLRLTGQPKRFGEGNRWAAFQYRMPDGAEHLLAVFRLPGGEQRRAIHVTQLDIARAYTLTWLGEDRIEQQLGGELMTQGIAFDLPEEGSALVLLR